jgi:hypothetical protein
MDLYADTSATARKNRMQEDVASAEPNTCAVHGDAEYRCW